MTGGVSLAARFDPETGLLRVGDVEVPFDVNLAPGSVAVRVGGREVSLRPLTWQEKVTLARFAHLGRDFVDRTLLRTAAGEAALDPQDGDREVLVALARWVNEREGLESLEPLDVGVLSLVTREVCRSLGVRPAELEAMTATEVEALWTSIREAGSEPVPPSGGWEQGDVRRILIVPYQGKAIGPVGRATGATEEARMESAAHSMPVPPPGPATTRVANPDAAEPGQRPPAASDPLGPVNAVEPGRRPGATRRFGGPAVTSFRIPEPDAAGRQRRPGAPEPTRLAAPSRTGDGGDRAQAEVVPARPVQRAEAVGGDQVAARHGAVEPAREALAREALAGETFVVLGVEAHRRSPAAHRSMSGLDRRSPVFEASAFGHPSMPRPDATVAPDRAALVPPPAEALRRAERGALVDAEEREALFEELADRLESAAARLGIGGER